MHVISTQVYMDSITRRERDGLVFCGRHWPFLSLLQTGNTGDSIISARHDIKFAKVLTTVLHRGMSRPCPGM